MANTEDRLSVSYQSNSPFGKLLGHYEDVLRAAAPIGVKYREDADGTAGVIFRAAQDQTSCTIKISRQSRVEVDCFLSAEAPTAPTPRESEVIGWTAGGSVMPVAAQSPVHQTQATSSQPAPHTDLAEAKSDLAAIQSEITAAQKIDAQYTGGLVKALSSSRIATLRQSEAALDQKLSSYKAGVPILRLSASDTQKLSEVESEITSTRNKIGQQQIEVARYSGGLTQAMSLATLETIRQTLAFLELRRISLKYSLPQIPTAGAAPTTGAEPRKATEGGRGPSMANCLKIQTFDSSVLSTNTVFMELAWKVDVANICATPQTVRAVFTIFDKDDFELDSASQELYVPANGIGNARGRMLVSPLEKARRMAKQGASLSLR